MVAPTITTYNLSGMANSSDNKLVSLMQFVSDPDPLTNSIYDYLVGNLLLITLFIIIFMSLKIRGHSTIASLTAASIVNLLLAILLFPIGVISGISLVISVVFFLGCAFWVWVGSQIF